MEHDIALFVYKYWLSVERRRSGVYRARCINCRKAYFKPI